MGHQHSHNDGHHDHHHHHGPDKLSDLNMAFFVGIGLNALFTIIEFVYGYVYNSLALISDASHNLSDVASLILSLLGMKLAQKAATISYTYGYKKASLLASLINAVLLFVVVFGIIREAIERLTSPPEVIGMGIVIVASIGVVINTISAFLFFKGQKDDINIRGAFLHLMVDALVSVGVVISGLVITRTGWYIIDPIISFIIAATIIFTTWSLLKESVRLVMDAVPKEIDTQKVIAAMEKVTGVASVHHVHIWALSSKTNALTAHIQLHENDFDDWPKVKAEIRHVLFHKNIGHMTLELEKLDENCLHNNCD